MSIISRPSSITLLRRLSLTRPSSSSIIRRNSSRTLQDLHRGTVASHLFAGALGGFLVIVGGYTWYYFSPLRPIVQTSKRVQIYAEAAKKGFTENLSVRVVELLRKTAKTYVAIVPGAEVLVDMAFDSLGDILEQHKEEVDRIAAKALKEVQKLVENGMDEIQTALKVLEVLKIRLGEIQALGANTRTTVEPLLERARGEILLLAERASKAKQAMDQRLTQIQSILPSQGISSVLRTIEEKAAWVRRPFGRGEGSTPETQEEQTNSQATEKGR